MLPTLSKYVTLKEFEDMVTGGDVDWRPAQEIMDEIDRKHAEAKVEKNGT